MGSNIQELFNNASPGSEIRLPAGEYEGPFYVRKTCNIRGFSTTLWAKKGPVLIVEAGNVSISSLSVEVTEDAVTPEEQVCIVSKADTKFDDVEIVGSVKGPGGEEQPWYIPKVILLEEFPANERATFTMEVDTPVACTISTNISDVDINPKQLPAGRGKLTVETGELKDGTFLYGEIILKSSFVRRLYVNGRASSNADGYVRDKCVYRAGVRQNAVSLSANSIIAPAASSVNLAVFKRGQRVAVKDLTGTRLKLSFSCTRMLTPMEVDPYVFLLDKNGKAVSDDRLIFFGNPASQCGGVIYNEGLAKTVSMDLDKIPADIQTVSLSYSIYGDNLNLNFSKIVDPTVSLIVDDEEKGRFTAEDLMLETTIVMLEFYRYKNEWRINMVGAGYKNGLKRLCESYGLEVV